MKYINTLKDGDKINDVYLVKSKSQATAKTGKEYFNILLQDKTGTLDSKVWDTTSPAIEDFDAGEFVYVEGDIISYNGAIQCKIIRISKADKEDYNPIDYFQTSTKDKNVMQKEFDELIDSVKNTGYKKLLEKIFILDKTFRKKFFEHQGAKSIHHSFIHGLLEHTVSTTKLAKLMASNYENLNIDLVITASLLHDIGKVREISEFPTNEYTDEGQLIGHIVIGYEIVKSAVDEIKEISEKEKTELLHCILSHHGSHEFGSPKLPGLIEAYIVSQADNTDAKVEIMMETIKNAKQSKKIDINGFVGFNKLTNTNFREASGSEI